MAYPISASGSHAVSLILHSALNRSKVIITPYTSNDFENKTFIDTINAEAKTINGNYENMVHLRDNYEHCIP